MSESKSDEKTMDEVFIRWITKTRALAPFVVCRDHDRVSIQICLYESGEVTISALGKVANGTSLSEAMHKIIVPLAAEVRDVARKGRGAADALSAIDAVEAPAS